MLTKLSQGFKLKYLYEILVIVVFAVVTHVNIFWEFMKIEF